MKFKDYIKIYFTSIIFWLFHITKDRIPYRYKIKNSILSFSWRLHLNGLYSFSVHRKIYDFLGGERL